MNGMSCGRWSLRITRPTVVSMYCFTNSIGSVCRMFWLSNALHQVDHLAGVAQLDGRERFHFAHFERDQHVVGGSESAAFALGAGARFGQVVAAEHHVLGGDGDGSAVRRRKNVVGRQHQRGSFDLRFGRERNVHGHLVAVEIGVERGADQRVNLDGLAFHQHRLESLDAEAVQRGSAVEQNGMVLDDLFEDVPNHRDPAARPVPWPA